MVEGIKLTATANSSVKITWTAHFLDEDGYIIERAEPGGVFTIKWMRLFHTDIIN